MKKHLIFLILIVTIAPSGLSQNIRPGIVGGVNFQNINGKDTGGDRLENSLTIGYHAGINLLIPFADEIYFQPGLLFSTKGALDKNDLTEIKVRLNYLELPLNLLYRGQLGNNFILLGFGPYLGFALGGNFMVNDDERKIKFQNSIDTGDPLTTPYMRRLDAGANIFAGYELENGLFLTINSQLGLLKINPDNNLSAEDESVWKNTGFGLSLGFRF